ncbi:MAG: S46 family peptidase [Hyphomonadaceae bacterium]|nr:S46 family peptidase [Hyphomonadaceae bacterium]
MSRSHIFALALILATPGSASAKEGMFTPDQLPEIAADLTETGLELEPESLTELTAFPMGAVISLGNCTASFVSGQGLAVTNHHCARGSIQYNSTAEQNYLEDGFLAESLAEELPAAPGSRVYVTQSVQDVTSRMRIGLGAFTRGRDVHAEIEARRKAIIAECEARDGHRCQVASFYGGAEYKLIDRLEIRDVRLVYAPADSIGKYGGDVDNWMWPRHTGDFAFYRAYVGPDGSPADYSEANIPYQPAHSLTVSGGGLNEGDFVMVLGYPGRTSRYARLAEVRNTFSWTYPAWQGLLEDWIAVIEETAPEGSDARIKYEARLASLNNFMKNLGGQIEGAERVGLLDRRAEREQALASWIIEQGDADTAQAITLLDMLSEQIAAADRRAFWYDHVRRPQLLSAARKLYRLARERELPDAEREPGFQERDMAFFRQSMEAIERRFDPVVDKAEWLLFLDRYMHQPSAARVPAYDGFMGLNSAPDMRSLAARLDGFYAISELDDLDTRLALMEADAATLEASEDPFMRLAVALYDNDRAMEEAEEELKGRMLRLRPAYMQAIRIWQADQGSTAYPDANSTLRASYGTIMPPASGEGLPFTTLEEIAEKDTGEAPFNAPQAQLKAIATRDHGRYGDEQLGTVAVNFLSDLDVTGGNSGSATLNARGELVGLLFDGTLDSVNSDWDFDPQTTRAIHVDTRYMMWVMDKVDGAQRILDEITIVGLPEEPVVELEPSPMLENTVSNEEDMVISPVEGGREDVEAAPTP